MRNLQVRGGRIRLTRLGGLNYNSQSRWSHAPEAHGLWAFPCGFDEPFYYVHQWHDRMPKRLRVTSSDSSAVRAAKWESQQQWLRGARRAHPLRHFWYAGDLYCHFAVTGVRLEPDQWSRMDARRYAEILISHGVDKVEYRGPAGGMVHDRDHLEVFLPRRAHKADG